MSDIDNKNKEINEFLNKSYEYGFTTEIESETNVKLRIFVTLAMPGK